MPVLNIKDSENI